MVAMTKSVNSVSKSNVVPQDKMIPPHEFVFIYQEQGVDSAKWTDFQKAIQSRLSLCSYGFLILDIQQEQGQKSIAVTHKDGHRIVQSMMYEGVICEFNLQQVLKFGFAPVFMHYIDLLDALNTLEYVLKNGY